LAKARLGKFIKIKLYLLLQESVKFEGKHNRSAKFSMVRLGISFMACVFEMFTKAA